MHSPSSLVAPQRLAVECTAAKNRLSNCSYFPPLQRVFRIGHRLPADLTSDDVHAPDPVYDLPATDASFEESRQIREAAMKARAEVSIRDRVEDPDRARPRTQTVLRPDDVFMVWQTNPPSKRGRWVCPGVCIGTHRGKVCVNIRRSLWKCIQLQCKLATAEESRDLEIQNQLLDDMKAEFQECPGRRVCTDVERERIPLSDADRPPTAPRACRKEENKNSALVPTLPVPFGCRALGSRHPEVLWQQQVDDHIWKNNGQPACLCQEEWDELFSNTCENITARVCFCRSEFTGLTATRMARGDELPRHMISESEWPRFLQATMAEWTAILDTSAVTIISPAAATHKRKHSSHRIFPSGQCLS